MAQAVQSKWDRQPWMAAPSVLRLFAALGAPEVDARFVGGCVRNAVIGAAVSEIDVATPEPPVKVIERLVAAGFKAIPTGIDHGTVTAIVDGIPFEVTTLRRDTACNGRHADVEFTTDWQEDSRRRDFTMNAMSLRPDGTLFDDHGGIEDAKAGRIRFVGAAADRIQEDYLRILRLFRFFAWYGRHPLDEATLAACREGAAGLRSLSAERIQQEITKLLAAPQPAPAIMAMDAHGVLQAILPEAVEPLTLEVLVTLEGEAPSFPPDWLRRLAVLISGDSADSVAQRLKLSNADRARLGLLTKTGTEISKDSGDTELRRLFYKLGAALVVDRTLLAWAQSSLGGNGDGASWLSILRAAVDWTPRRLPITGDDVLALGVPPGPQVGVRLTEIETYWIDSGFNTSRDDLLRELRRRCET